MKPSERNFFYYDFFLVVFDSIFQNFLVGRDDVRRKNGNTFESGEVNVETNPFTISISIFLFPNLFKWRWHVYEKYRRNSENIYEE